MTFSNRLVSLSSTDDDGIDHSNGHSNSHNNTTTCEVIFDVNVLSANFNKSKDGNTNLCTNANTNTTTNAKG